MFRCWTALCVLGLAGCAQSVPHRAAAVFVGDQGGAWEVVLPGADVSQELAYGAEASRRDAALGGCDEAPPMEERPSLDDARRLFLDHRANEFIYFVPPRRDRSWYGWR